MNLSVPIMCVFTFLYHKQTFASVFLFCLLCTKINRLVLTTESYILKYPVIFPQQALKLNPYRIKSKWLINCLEIACDAKCTTSYYKVPEACTFYSGVTIWN
jgi:hypothetical protein